MIYDNVPETVEIVPKGYTQIQPWRKLMYVDWYTELMGGLGDALLRVYSHEDCYSSLGKIGPDQKAAVVLMCHNPALSEIFKWHPKFISGQLTVFDLGFRTPFHPWENKAWRVSNGLPLESPCPSGGPIERPEIFPSLIDSGVLNGMKKPYILLNPSAGTQDRDIPHKICQQAVTAAIARGFDVFTIGHSKYARNPDFNGAVNLVDRLTVPGMMAAVRAAAGVITSHTSVTHVAWGERRPVFLLYPEWVKDAYVSRGAVGHMVGIDRPDNDHMLMVDFSETRLDLWLEKIGRLP